MLEEIISLSKLTGIEAVKITTEYNLVLDVCGVTPEQAMNHIKGIYESINLKYEK